MRSITAKTEGGHFAPPRVIRGALDVSPGRFKETTNKKGVINQSTNKANRCVTSQSYISILMLRKRERIKFRCKSIAFVLIISMLPGATS